MESFNNNFTMNRFENIKCKSISRFITAIILSITLLPNMIEAQQLAAGNNRFIGAGSSSFIYGKFNNYFNQITPGNEGKWGSVEPVQGTYNWSGLDQIYNYSQNNDILFKEHTLVWGNQQPSWISSLDSAAQREAVEKWIQALGERYPNLDLVDVVNEPIHAKPSYKNALGGDGETGWDWVITAFELARQYCSENAKLILNEYNVLHSTSSTSDYLEIINLLKERDLIDGIGIQGHYFEFRSSINATNNNYIYNTNVIESNLKKLSDTGIPVYITEFDINEPIDQNQLEQYQIYFPIFWNNPMVKGITFWGYIENDVWGSYPDTYLLYSNGRERPALGWLRTFVKVPLTPTIISPDDVIDIPLDTSLIWHPSELAESYNVQLSFSREFTSIIMDTTITDTVLQLNSLEPDMVYYWRVAASNEEGTSQFSNYAYFVTQIIVGVEDEKRIPSEFNLHQNFPNPFNPTTNISYYLPEASKVNIDVFDVLGRHIQSLVNSEQTAGDHSITFNAENLSSGIYFYRIKAGSFLKTKQMLLTK